MKRSSSLTSSHLDTTVPVYHPTRPGDCSDSWSVALSSPEQGVPRPSRFHWQRSRLGLVVKALTHNENSVSINDTKSLIPELSRHRATTLSRRIGKMSGAFFRAVAEPTIIHRKQSKGRIPIGHAFQPSDDSKTTLLQFSQFPSVTPTTGDMDTESSKSSPTNNNSNPSMSPDYSTAQSSLDSRFYPSPPNNAHYKSSCTRTSEKKHLQRHQLPALNSAHANRRGVTTPSSPETNLTTIQETALDQASPSVLTVERAAAAKIYLETYFDELLTPGPSARSIRLQLLETHLINCGALDGNVSPSEVKAVRADFFRRESEHLRKSRVLKARSTVALMAQRGAPEASLENDWDVLKILGKGSFGVVRLVREKSQYREEDPSGRSDGWSEASSKQVYAMKVIRKSDMLRTSQEGHLRAERDFLVASEGSKWIIPLIASFQDTSNLYLVMEYMPGGDFLGLLIRENILHESVARFYIAEMILCVEAAHALKIIHRDIKPDNFLISASGHLKISDFGLAFDGHWSHDAAYFNSHRYSLLNKLGIHLEGDDQDKAEGRSLQATMKWASGIMTGIDKHEKKITEDGETLLSWRNRCGNRTSAVSVVGTSQYMAPEVIEGKKYKETFHFPRQPAVSARCQQLITSLIDDKENRLCSKRYRFKDLINVSMTAQPNPSGTTGGPSLGTSSYGHRRKQQPDLAVPRDFAGRYVFPYDAEDIKAHKWFRGVPWDRLHEIDPPYVPHLRGPDDTHYFDDEDPISDWSDSSEESEPEEPSPTSFSSPIASDPHGSSSPVSPTTPSMLGSLKDLSLGSRPPNGKDKIRSVAKQALQGFKRDVQKWALTAIATPYDRNRLHNLDSQIDEKFLDLASEEREMLKQFVRVYGKKDRKRPRDKLLRDKNTKAVVMDVRKRTAFLGYTWRRMNHDSNGAVRQGLERIWPNVGSFVSDGNLRGQDGTINADGVGFGSSGGYAGYAESVYANHAGCEWEEDREAAVKSLRKGRLSWL
ncbi:kinase-like domain-containing protein [Sordaria sp. MPI-SDFR-AT-0083]|nr:kinase-like domain-containing protein [Sordaria sp. MPI-SDFR-AT-0083]